MIRSNPTLVALLRARREAALMTRETAAKRLKITPEYLAHIERGGRPVHISNSLGERLVKLLKISEKKFWFLVQDQNTRTRHYYARFARKI
jgi:transcriptional regulator with XRE-family HTH domain